MTTPLLPGLNFVAGLILLHVPSEPAAFGLLSVLLLERGLRTFFVDGMAHLQTRLWQLARLLDPPLAAHLDAVGAPTVLWAAPWFLTCFASTFPVGVAARAVDVLLGGTPVRAPVLAVARAFARLGAPAALAAADMEGAVTALRDGVPRLPEARLHEAMTDALCVAWTPAEAAVLDSADGPAFESVADTVARLADGGETPAVASAAPAPSPRPALRWAPSEPAAVTTTPDGRLAPPPPSPGVAGRASAPVGDLLSGGRAEAASPPPRPPSLLTSVASLRLADAALPPADAAADFLSAALAKAGDEAAPPPLAATTATPSSSAAVPALPVAPHAAAAAALPPVGGDRRRGGGGLPSGGSDEWGAFASADAEAVDDDAARVGAALESWGPFASADGVDKG